MNVTLFSFYLLNPLATNEWSARCTIGYSQETSLLLLYYDDKNTKHIYFAGLEG